MCVPLRSVSAGSSVLQRSCAFQQREAKMQPGTAVVRSGSSPEA